MGLHKQYSGYRSYDYLNKGLDYPSFDLVNEISRVKPYVVPVSKEEEAHVQNLLEKCVVISLHDHPRVLPKDMSELFAYNQSGREITAYEGLSVSGMDAVFDNLLDGSCIITSKMGWKWTDVIHDLGMKLCDIAHQDMVVRCERSSDITKAYKNGRIALAPSLEASTMIENEVDRIDILYGLGVRMMGIVYSESNALGSGLRETRDGGLTHFGGQAVQRMNQLGMAIDVSHSGDQTALDVIQASKQPIFISHVGARTLWDTNRMMPDRVLKACAERGGVIGIEAAPHTTLTEKHPEHSIESFMEHFEYCVDLVGPKHVAFGPDTNFGDHVRLHHLFRKFLSIQEAHGKKAYIEVDFVKGLENPSECFTNIMRWLVKHGYSDNEIESVVGENVLEVLRQVW